MFLFYSTCVCRPQHEVQQQQQASVLCTKQQMQCLIMQYKNYCARSEFQTVIQILYYL